MTEAKRDNNGIPVILGASSADGSTPVPIKVDPTTHIMVTDVMMTGSDLSDENAKRDANSITTLLGVSSVDGVTPVPIYANPSTGGLFLQMT